MEKADHNYILTDIKTKITLPDGSPVILDPNSTIIYKITKRQVMPALPDPPKK